MLHSNKPDSFARLVSRGAHAMTERYETSADLAPRAVTGPAALVPSETRQPPVSRAAGAALQERI
ncbi:MAG TPA: hypothetical protein VFF88_10625, partial [Methylocella sp.]|nr:hypothetical protein [Methylocella sp.]